MAQRRAPRGPDGRARSRHGAASATWHRRKNAAPAVSARASGAHASSAANSTACPGLAGGSSPP
jgi:hypothetical protein